MVRVPTRTTTGTLKDIFGYSSDQQPAQISLSVTFAIADDGVEALYTQFGKIDNLYELAIVPIVKQEIKTVFGQFTAIRSVQHREELNNKTREPLSARSPSTPICASKASRSKTLISQMPMSRPLKTG